VAVACLYAASFVLPAYRYRQHEDPGWKVCGDVLDLIVSRWDQGGSALLSAWLANPLLWLGLACLLAGRLGAAGVAGVVATLLAAVEMWPWSAEVTWLAGGYLWLGSMALLTILSLGLGWAGAGGTCWPPGPRKLGRVRAGAGP